VCDIVIRPWRRPKGIRFKKCRMFNKRNAKYLFQLGECLQFVEEVPVHALVSPCGVCGS
jgi:hypothetical protein